jgi:hypothetical protein
MSTARQRLEQIGKPSSFDDQLTPVDVANIENSAHDLEATTHAIISQIKRIIHGNNPGKWKDDPVEFINWTPGSGTVEFEFAFDDFVDGKILICSVSENRFVPSISLEIKDEFDDDIQFTIGDSDAVARLMQIDQNAPNSIGTYKNDPDVRYSAETNIYIYTIGTPTKGLAKVIL